MTDFLLETVNDACPTLLLLYCPGASLLNVVTVVVVLAPEGTLKF